MLPQEDYIIVVCIPLEINDHGSVFDTFNIFIKISHNNLLFTRMPCGFSVCNVDGCVNVL